MVLSTDAGPGMHGNMAITCHSMIRYDTKRKKSLTWTQKLSALTSADVWGLVTGHGQTAW